MFIQGRKDFPPILLGSVAGPKNYTDKRQIIRKKDRFLNSRMFVRRKCDSRSWLEFGAHRNRGRRVGEGHSWESKCLLGKTSGPLEGEMGAMAVVR